jgi:hypothetical protein
MPLPKDLREFIESLNSHRVDYLIVGAHALAFYGIPRYTGDLGILVRVSPENAARLEQVLAKFSFASPGLCAKDFVTSDQVIQLGLPPNRIDLLTSITGVEFDEAWAGRVSGDLHGTAVAFIGTDAFIKNKRAAGRTTDKADLEALGAEVN